MIDKNFYIPQEIADNLDPNSRVEYQWVIDSETGDRVLVDVKTSQEIGRWIKRGEVI